MTQQIIVFLLAFKEKPLLSLSSLSFQTWKPSKVVIVAAYPSACIKIKFKNLKVENIIVPPDLSLTVGERVGIALTIAFKRYDISRYDYILKLDSDVLFNEHFIEDNIKSGYDLVGGGSAMLIKSSIFLKIFDLKWPISAIDDAYVIEAFKAKGYKVLEWNWASKPISLRSSHFSIARRFRAGIEMYRCGIPFVNLLYRVLLFILRYPKLIHTAMAMIIGFVIAPLIKRRKYDIASEVENFYKRNLSRSLKEKLRLST
jgi:hypothetical protein